MIRLVFTLVFLFTTLLPAAELVEPGRFLGFPIGADGRLARYDAIKDYFNRIAAASERVRLENIGTTTEGEEMIMAVVAAPEVLSDLPRYLEISRRLAQAEVGQAEAPELTAAGRAIVFITCNLHSTEIASSQLAMELLYRLAADQDSETLKILDNLIVVIVPSVNPDGQKKVVDWNEKTRGTPYEGSALPYLYHKYAGHDNNRDWYRLSLKETVLLSRQLYHRWFPQVLVDIHQMGSAGDRFFVPPYNDPPTPGLHPLVWRGVNWLSTRAALEMEKAGLAGVASRGHFSGWWIGALDDTAWFHNVFGILFEAASVRLAGPIYLEPEEVSSGESRNNDIRIFSPHPWAGGWWRLADIIRYEMVATMAVLRAAADKRGELLEMSRSMAQDQQRQGREQAPFAYVIPREQWDPSAAQKMVLSLLRTNVRVFRLDAPLRAGDLVFGAGSYLVPLAQPYRAFVKNIFDRQYYPDLRSDSRDRPRSPYDMAAWTLQLGMGVRVQRLDREFQARMHWVDESDLVRGPTGKLDGPGLALDPRLNASYRAAALLLRAGVRVLRSRTPLESLPAGAFILPDGLGALKKATWETELPVLGVSGLDQAELFPLKQPRVGLYKNFGHNMKAGWLRYVLDEHAIEHEILRPADLARPKRLSGFDLLIFPDISAEEISRGVSGDDWERWSAPRPPEFSGGIGAKGLKALEDFLAAGGSLLFSGRSCAYAINNFKLPVNDIGRNNDRLNSPGSYLRVQVKETPLTWGLPAESAVFFRRDPVFQTRLPPRTDENRSTPLVFARRDLLLSGWLDGEEELVNRSLVLDFRRGAGRIVLIGPDLVHRSQGEANYKLLFNLVFAERR